MDGLLVGIYIDADEIGGAERSTFSVVAGASDRFRFTVITPSTVVVDAARVYVPAVDTVLVPRAHGRLDGLREIRSTLRSLDIDLLHVSMGNPFVSTIPVIAARTARVPVVAVEHLVIPSRRRRGALLKRLTSRFFSAHVAVGHASAEDLHRLFGIPLESITVIHHGVDRDRVEPVAPLPSPLLGCAARLEDQKGLDVLVAAMAKLPECSLVLVGDGSRRDDLLAQAAASGVADRVCSVGWVDDARPYIAGMDVFVLPSRNEAFPLTVLEAMAQRVPVVASNVGSVSEAVVDGETGLLVPPDDVDALTFAIRRILTDDVLRRSMVDVAEVRLAERFDAAAMARAYETLWENVSRRRG